MADQRSTLTLTTIMHRLTGLLAGSVVFEGSDIVLDTADDGTPSMSIPLRNGGAIVITPMPDRHDRYAILVATDAGIEEVEQEIAGEGVFNTLLRRICPW